MAARFGLENIAEILRDKLAKRVVVMAGAGISTPSGLPDFRSPGSGLYDNLAKYNLPFPTAVFDINYFYQNPKPFFQVAKLLYPGLYPPNETHWFVRLLHDKQQLLRMYTQNIDGLETPGIPKDALVEAHGSFSSATCLMCRAKYAALEIKATIFADEIPKCSKCEGIIKPDIVFFGEMLPNRFMMHMIDMPLSDLLIVLGTSLEVEPFASICRYVPASTPRLLINKFKVGAFLDDPQKKDVVLEGDVVDGILKLTSLAGWDSELMKLKSSYQSRSPDGG